MNRRGFLKSLGLGAVSLTLAGCRTEKIDEESRYSR